MDELVALASSQLERIKVAVTQAGLKYLDLSPNMFGVGISIAWSEADYVVLSVMGGGNENQLLTTCGVLRDIKQDRLAALDACNRRNQSNTAYPLFLHDAEIGWDILVQQTSPVELMLDVPPFFLATIESLPRVTQAVREDFAKDWSLDGQPYRWNDEDVNRLFMRSML